MEAKVRYPGSFGEVIQGKVSGHDMLLSCPVNVYTNVKIYETNNPTNKNKYEKSSIFLYNVLKEWNLEGLYKNMDIEINSDIPCGKGMASSTADLCALYYCLIKMFDRQFNEDELKNQCIRIEPTDSIIYDKMTLFDYKFGNTVYKIGSYFKYNILAFEGRNIVNTVEFNNRVLPSLSDVDDLIPYLKQAVQEKNSEKLSFVSTESILRNQKRLKYDWIEEIIRIKNNTGGLGIIGAHSGSVLGIIYDDKQKTEFALKTLKNYSNLFSIYSLKTLMGMRII